MLGQKRTKKYLISCRKETEQNKVVLLNRKEIRIQRGEIAVICAARYLRGGGHLGSIQSLKMWILCSFFGSFLFRVFSYFSGIFLALVFWLLH